MENSEKKSPVMPFIFGLIVGIAGFYLISLLIPGDGDYTTPPVVLDPCEDWDPSSAPNGIEVGAIDPSTLLSLSIDDSTEQQGGVFNKCVLQYLVDSCEGEMISYRFAALDGKVGLYLADNFEASLEDLAFFTAEDAFCPMRCE